MSQEGQKLNPFKGIETITNTIHKAKNLKLKREQFNHKKLQDKIRNEIDRKRLDLGYKKIDLGHTKIKSNLTIQNIKKGMNDNKNKTTLRVSENNKQGNFKKAEAVKYAADKKNEMNKRDNLQKKLDRQEKAKARISKANIASRAQDIAKAKVDSLKKNMSWSTKAQ